MSKYFAVILVLIFCFSYIKPAESNPHTRDGLQNSEINSGIDTINYPAAQITYHLYNFSKKNTVNKLLKKIGKDNLENILALNRIDKLKREPLVIPDTISGDFNIYAPFPHHIERIKEVKKIIFVSQKIQAFAAYESGNLVFWGPVSSGKESTPTPNGLFHTNWKAKKQISTDDPTWILYWNFNIINAKGVSLHQFELPGYPASHSCVRLLERSAYKIYNWAEQWILTPDCNSIKCYGTPVILFGEFTTPKIWRLLAKEKELALINENEINEQLDEYLPTILQRQKDREAYLEKKK